MLRVPLRILVGVAAAVAVAAAVGRVAGVFGGSAPELGAVAGRLSACKPSPNCVSSQADPADAVHFIVPLRFPPSIRARSGGEDAEVPAAAFAELRRIVAGGTRVRIVGEAPGYLRAEYRSRIMGFVDDVEFLLDERARVIHVRSASRLGHGDFGVNRARIETIRAQLAGG